MQGLEFTECGLGTSAQELRLRFGAQGRGLRDSAGNREEGAENGHAAETDEAGDVRRGPPEDRGLPPHEGAPREGALETAAPGPRITLAAVRGAPHGAPATTDVEVAAVEERQCGEVCARGMSDDGKRRRSCVSAPPPDVAVHEAVHSPPDSKGYVLDHQVTVRIRVQSVVDGDYCLRCTAGSAPCFHIMNLLHIRMRQPVAQN